MSLCLFEFRPYVENSMHYLFSPSFNCSSHLVRVSLSATPHQVSDVHHQLKDQHAAQVDGLSADLHALRRDQAQLARDHARHAKTQAAEREALEAALRARETELAAAVAERAAAAAQMDALNRQIGQHLGSLLAGAGLAPPASASAASAATQSAASTTTAGSRRVKFVSPVNRAKSAAAAAKDAPAADQSASTAIVAPAAATDATTASSSLASSPSAAAAPFDSIGALSLQDTLDLVRQKVQLLSAAPSIPDTMSVIWFKDVMVKPAWQGDCARDDCTICQTGFGFFNRRHHCRMCGFLFCHSCSSKTMPIPHNNNQIERVCDICAVKVRFHVAKLGK
jgi:hypothetical protein